MRKSDLKDGMVVEIEGRYRFLVLRNNLVGKSFSISLNEFDKDLKNGKKTILKVFGTKINDDTNVYSITDSENLTLLWELEEKVDWSKVAVGTKVQVRGLDVEKWRNAYFIEYCENKAYKYKVNIVTNDAFLINNNTCSYAHCRLYKED